MYTQEDISGLSQEGFLVNGVGIIAVYPQGISGKDGKAAWQGASYSAPGVDDVSPLQFFSTPVNAELIM